jgi:hypothetical protein
MLGGWRRRWAAAAAAQRHMHICGLCQAPPPLALQIIFVGNSGVGKTCLMGRLFTDKFNPNTPATIGAAAELHPPPVPARGSAALLHPLPWPLAMAPGATCQAAAAARRLRHPLQAAQVRQQEHWAHIVGHGGPGALPGSHQHLLPRRAGRRVRWAALAPLPAAALARPGRCRGWRSACSGPGGRGLGARCASGPWQGRGSGAGPHPSHPGFCSSDESHVHCQPYALERRPHSAPAPHSQTSTPPRPPPHRHHPPRRCAAVYDVTSRDSLHDVQRKWMSEFRLYGTFPSAVQMLVANKVDLVGGRPGDACADEGPGQCLARRQGGRAGAEGAGCRIRRSHTPGCDRATIPAPAPSPPPPPHPGSHPLTPSAGGAARGER